MSVNLEVSDVLAIDIRRMQEFADLFFAAADKLTGTATEYDAAKIAFRDVCREVSKNWESQPEESDDDPVVDLTDPVLAIHERVIKRCRGMYKCEELNTHRIAHLWW